MKFSTLTILTTALSASTLTSAQTTTPPYTEVVSDIASYLSENGFTSFLPSLSSAISEYTSLTAAAATDPSASSELAALTDSAYSWASMLHINTGGATSSGTVGSAIASSISSYRSSESSATMTMTSMSSESASARVSASMSSAMSSASSASSATGNGAVQVGAMGAFGAAVLGLAAFL